MQAVTDIEKKLASVVSEMISTERTYNAGLTVLGRALLQTKLVGRNQTLMDFANVIPKLKNISDDLLKNAETAVSEGVSFEEHSKLKRRRTELLMDYFTAMAPYESILDAYSNPVETVESGFFQWLVSFFKKLFYKEPFVELESFIQKETNQSLLASLILPIQRGPRYKLLVKEAKETGLGLLDMENDPTQYSLEEIKAITHGKDAVILFKNELYYAKKNKPVTTVDVSNSDPDDVVKLKSMFSYTYKLADDDALQLLYSIKCLTKNYSSKSIVDECQAVEPLIHDALLRLNKSLQPSQPQESHESPTLPESHELPTLLESQALPESHESPTLPESQALLESHESLEPLDPQEVHKPLELPQPSIDIVMPHTLRSGPALILANFRGSEIEFLKQLRTYLQQQLELAQSTRGLVDLPGALQLLQETQRYYWKTMSTDVDGRLNDRKIQGSLEWINLTTTAARLNETIKMLKKEMGPCQFTKKAVVVRAEEDRLAVDNVPAHEAVLLPNKVVGKVAAPVLVGSANVLTMLGLFETGQRSFNSGLQKGLSKATKGREDAETEHSPKSICEA